MYICDPRSLHPRLQYTGWQLDRPMEGFKTYHPIWGELSYDCSWMLQKIGLARFLSWPQYSWLVYKMPLWSHPLPSYFAFLSTYPFSIQQKHNHRKERKLKSVLTAFIGMNGSHRICTAGFVATVKLPTWLTQVKPNFLTYSMDSLLVTISVPHSQELSQIHDIIIYVQLAVVLIRAFNANIQCKHSMQTYWF